MTIRNFDTIKQYVLTLGGFEESLQLDLQIQSIINEALAYCYRDDVPKEMELPLAEVIVNELNKRNNAVNTMGFDGITSYKEGDMQITLGGGSSSGTSANIKYNGKLEGFKLIIGAGKTKRCKCDV